MGWAATEKSQKHKPARRRRPSHFHNQTRWKTAANHTTETRNQGQPRARDKPREAQGQGREKERWERGRERDEGNTDMATSIALGIAFNEHISAESENSREIERVRGKVTAKESSGSIWQLQANGAENGDTETSQNGAPKWVCWVFGRVKEQKERWELSQLGKMTKHINAFPSRSKQVIPVAI